MVELTAGRIALVIDLAKVYGEYHDEDTGLHFRWVPSPAKYRPEELHFNFDSLHCGYAFMDKSPLLIGQTLWESGWSYVRQSTFMGEPTSWKIYESRI